MIITAREINAVIQSYEYHGMQEGSRIYSCLREILKNLVSKGLTRIDVEECEYWNLIKKQAEKYEQFKKGVRR